MRKILKADADAYITNKVIKGTRVTGSNVGAAGSLDLFKIYGMTFSGSQPNVELSRALVHFDLTNLRDMFEKNLIDIDDPSFFCRLRLRDVYGGQTTPVNFTMDVFPLSASFLEGGGRDSSFYGDKGWCNWLSSSHTTPWFVTGCSGQCTGASPGDYITGSISIPSTRVSQYFSTGEEDLDVDVTKIVSATLTGEIPDSGFRISYSSEVEGDNRTYFVKRFGTRHTYDNSKQPSLVVGFNDSIVDDSQNLSFDSPGRLVLYNFAGGELRNIASGSSLTEITGVDCVILKLTTPVSGGNYETYFTGSQLSLGTTGGKCFVTGTYFADVTLLSSDPTLVPHIAASGSLRFKPIWTSIDGSVAYVSGSEVTVRSPNRSPSRSYKKYTVGVLGIKDTYSGEKATARVHVFDQSSPLIKVARIPVELPGIVVKRAYYRIRDSVTNEIVVPFDDTYDSTRISSDASGMFFEFDTDGLPPGRTYVIDVMIQNEGIKSQYDAVSPVFRVALGPAQP